MQPTKRVSTDRDTKDGINGIQDYGSNFKARSSLKWPMRVGQVKIKKQPLGKCTVPGGCLPATGRQ
jgi:hypothetical protein